MANPTTNYGFVLPTSTDLVTDLPADFDVALQGVDTRLKALQPGTTLGDIAYSSATANTNTRLAIGSSGNVLTVSGGVPAWTAPASADSQTLIATASLSGATAVQFTSIPTTYTHIYCVFIDCYSSSSYWNVRFNNDSGNNYNSQAMAGSTSSGNSGVAFAGVGDQNAKLGIIPQTVAGAANGTANGQMQIFNYKSTTLKRAGIWQSTGYDGSAYSAVAGSFCYNSTGTAITQIDFVRGSTQTITGTIQLWGVK